MTIATQKPQHTITGLIWDIKKYALHDGPGIRTTVFFKGCPLQCHWCCNPESLKFKPEILWIKENCIGCDLCKESCPSKSINAFEVYVKGTKKECCDLCLTCVDRCPGNALQLIGRRVSVDKVLEEITKDSVFYRRTGGGLTLSGGEPLLQPDFACELLKNYKIREFGAHSSIETSGYTDWKNISPLIQYTDIFLYDIKHMDPVKHKGFTGISNEVILTNAKKLAELCKKMIIRFPIIPGYNDSEENIRMTAEFVQNLPGVENLDILNYHRLGESKYARLGKDYKLAGISTVSLDRLNEIRGIIESYGINVKIGG